MSENDKLTSKRRPGDGVVMVYKRPYLVVEFEYTKDEDLTAQINGYYEGHGYIVDQGRDGKRQRRH